MKTIWKQALNIDIPTPFPRMSFNEAISRFGSDKPDTRFALELKDVTHIFKGSSIDIFSKAINQGETVKAINIKKLGNLGQKEADSIQEEARRTGAKVPIPYGS